MTQRKILFIDNDAASRRFVADALGSKLCCGNGRLRHRGLLARVETDRT